MLKRLLFGLLGLLRRMRLGWLKLTGRTENDVHAQRIVTGKSWNEFCDSLKSAGAALVYPGAPRDPFNQAEGYRYLTRLTRAALEAFVEYADPAYPVLRRMVHETVKLGADNPDNFYQNCRISGEYEYRLRGTRGTITYLSFAVQRGDYGSTGKLEPSSRLEASELITNEDGTFEIILSQEKKGQNWLKLDPDSSMLMVRQSYLDRRTEILAQVEIERLDGSALPEPISPALVDKGLTTAGAFVAGASLFFANWARGFKKHPNQLPLFDESVSTAAGGDPNIDYYHSYWQLGSEEALVIEFRPPECEHWNFQLNNHWMESLDYRYFPIHTNKFLARYRKDGSVRLIVAHRDPGRDNWIDTVNHQQGTMLLRWVKASGKLPIPTCQVIPFDQLSDLPA